MRLSEKINDVVHPYFVRYVRYAYYRKIKKIFRIHPELSRPVDPQLVARHRALWERTGLPCTDLWLRFYVNLTGIEDYRYCPEDIFFARIERLLTPGETAGHGIEDKNYLDAAIGHGFAPEAIVRYMRGAFFDYHYRWMSDDDVDHLLSSDSGPLVCKPCVASSGGHGVELCRFAGGNYYVNGKKLDSGLIRSIGGASYCVQRMVVQDDFSAHFNPASVNTCRLMTLRCPWDGSTVLLKSMIRIGATDSVTDNLMRGGVSVAIDSRGYLGETAYDYKGKAYKSHPVSGVAFSGRRHPLFEDMAALAVKVAETMPYFNLLSFDMTGTSEGDVKIIEVNSSSQGISGLQRGQGGLFGEQSERLVEWCSSNLHLDSFRHFRTFY